MVLTLTPLQTLAADSGAYLIHSSAITYYDDFNAAWSASKSGDTVGILKDKKLSDRVNLSSGSRTVELNGHKLYRENSSEQSNGAIINVSNGASLTVYGGRLAWTLDGSAVTMPADEDSTIPGTYYDNAGLAATSGTASNNTVWRMYYFDYDEKEVLYAQNDSRYTVSGGLLSGGWTSGNGGCIQLTGKNSSASLYDVTVAGNMADDSGGGIAMSDNYQKLKLVDSRIAFNQAEDDDGGGIYIGGNYCKVYLTRSHVDYNLSLDNGGGISVDGENAVIAGDAQRVNPDDENYPAKWTGNTFTGQPYANLSGENNPFWGRTENSSSRNISTAGKLSTVAYNIITDSDLDGGGGGIYIDGKNASIGGLNIMKNLALGLSYFSTFRGRGAGVQFNTEGNTLANSNVWMNWSRSEGGGVFIDNDACALTDVTVTENCSDINGLSGGGVYVLGSVNLSIGGQCIIKDNTNGQKSADNLYLGYYNAMYARLYPSLTKGSEVWLWMGGPATSITKVAGDYDERMFFSDKSTHHVEYKDQILQLVEGENSAAYIARKYPRIPETAFVPNDPISDGSRTKKLAKSYTSGNNNQYDLYQGVAEFPSVYDGTIDLSSTFFYSDGYFDRAPKDYEDHLATASLHLAMASFYSTDGFKGSDVLYDSDNNGTFYPVKSNNIRQFLSDIGVQEKDIYLNDSNIQKPGQFTIGVAIGSKTITLGSKEKKLVILGIRGANYEQEWVSNMTLGPEGEAKGFGSAADQVFTELTNYLNRKGIDGSSEDTIFWMAGYSRAGATSNLTGARIVDRFDNDGSRTFVYTFEAPQGGMSTVRDNPEKYYCIHNIVNDSDFVPKVGPTAMGFQRYGVDHYLPGDPIADARINESRDYNVLRSDGTKAETKYFTVWRDNNAYSVGSSAYNSQKTKMLKQLKCISGYDLIFNDYFHTATISYFGNTIFGNYGWQMIDEDSDMQTNIPSDKRNAAAFCEYFWDDVQEHALNFIVDPSGNPIYKLYRTSYSQATLEGVTVEQALASAVGVVYSLSPQQMDGLMEIAGTLMNRIDVNSLYFNYLKASENWEVYATASGTGAAIGTYFFPVVGTIIGGAVGGAGTAIYNLFVGTKTAGEFSTEIWTALNVPTETQLKDPTVEAKYIEDRAKGYRFLQDVLDDEQITTLKEIMPALCFWLLDYLKYDYDETGNDVLGTLAYNITRIFTNHDPEITLAWLRSYDDYYDNETSIVKMADSAKVTSVAPPIANDTESSSVTLSYAEPLLTLTVPGDVNQGAGIFYQFVGDNEILHPYGGPITLTTDSEAVSTTYTVKTYAIHDGIRSDPNTITVTLTQDDLFSYTCPDGMGGSTTEQLILKTDKTYHFEGPVLETMAFKNWTWTDDSKQTGLNGLDMNARTNDFTVQEGGKYHVQGNYYEKSNAVTLTMDPVVTETALPAEATLTGAKKLNSSSYTAQNVKVPVSWNKETDETYTATMYLSVDATKELCYIGQKQEGAFASYDTVLNAVVSASSSNGSGITVTPAGSAVGTVNADGSAEVRQDFTIAGYTDPNDIRTLTIKAHDMNMAEGTYTNFASGTDVITCRYAKGTHVSLPIPAVTSERYVSINNSNGINVTRENDFLKFEMPDSNDKVLILNYKPIVHHVTFVVSSAPTGGKTLPNYVGSVATIENDWAVTDGITGQWSPAGTKAAYSTPYTMELTLDKSAMKGVVVTDNTGVWSPSEWGDTRPLAGAIEFGEDIIFTVMDAEGNSIPAVCTVTSHDPFKVGVTFQPTAKVPVTAVTPPEMIMMPNSSTPSDWSAALPGTVPVTLADGTVGEVSVSWEFSTSTEQTLDGYPIKATGTLTSDLYDLETNGFSASKVTVTIFVQPAPQTEAPKAALLIGGAESDARSYGEAVTVGKDEGFSVKLSLSADLDAVIYYTLGDGEPDTVYTGPIEIGWGNETDNGKRGQKTVAVKAYAKKAGYRDSGMTINTYTLSKEVPRSGGGGSVKPVPVDPVPGGQDYRSCEKDKTCPITPFTDASRSAWYHDGVHYCLEKGIMNGMQATVFAPNGDITRAMVAAMLYRLEGSPAVSGTCSFGDVRNGDWFYDAVLWAKQTGVVNGLEETKFAPKNSITREQLAAMMYRYAEYKGVDVSDNSETVSYLSYADASAVSQWAVPTMDWSVSAGLINGMTQTTLVPKGTATRAQTATIFLRLCENILP